MIPRAFLPFTPSLRYTMLFAPMYSAGVRAPTSKRAMSVPAGGGAARSVATGRTVSAVDKIFPRAAADVMTSEAAAKTSADHDVKPAAAEELVELECGICFSPTAALVTQLCGDSCTAAFCAACVTAHFESIIDSGFAGACPRMRCPADAKRVAPSTRWRTLVALPKFELFEARAAALLSLQCVGCHTRKHIFEAPAAGRGEAARELEKIDAELASALRDEYAVAAIDEAEMYAKIERVAARTPPLDLPCGAPFVLSAGRSDGTPCAAMTLVLHAIADAERRASLQLRYLRHFPAAFSKCCKRAHCFVCRTADVHAGRSCAAARAAKATPGTVDEIVTCPQCAVSIAKGDGCNSINCPCGKSFDWGARLKAQKKDVADVLLGAHDGCEAAAGGAAVRATLAPRTAPPELIAQAAAFKACYPPAFAKGQAKIWRGSFPGQSDRFVAHVALAITPSQFSARLQSSRSAAAAVRASIGAGGEDAEEAGVAAAVELATAWRNALDSRLMVSEALRERAEGAVAAFKGIHGSRAAATAAVALLDASAHARDPLLSAWLASNREAVNAAQAARTNATATWCLRWHGGDVAAAACATVAALDREACGAPPLALYGRDHAAKVRAWATSPPGRAAVDGFRARRFAALAEATACALGDGLAANRGDSVRLALVALAESEPASVRSAALAMGRTDRDLEALSRWATNTLPKTTGAVARRADVDVWKAANPAATLTAKALVAFQRDDSARCGREKQMDDMSDEELRTWHRRHFGTSTCQVCGETFATPSQMYVHHGKAHYKPTPGIHSGV